MEVFGVLSKDNCLFFYILSVFSLIMFVGTIIIGIISSKSKLHVVLLSSLGPLVAYYMQRLFYSMCEGSLR